MSVNTTTKSTFNSTNNIDAKNTNGIAKSSEPSETPDSDFNTTKIPSPMSTLTSSNVENSTSVCSTSSATGASTAVPGPVCDGVADVNSYNTVVSEIVAASNQQQQHTLAKKTRNRRGGKNR